ncbi:diaminopimelate epimerase [Gillisia limnaea]|uniref:Diaminopimelate epimerase n=1 Tax=Gillisia limnaea (strain DSM 15749 / LMG 21470 / R-8282) TaxID=865937 RepID=H2BWZ9_GILLR|nr:diaminopimelate epimerase [Gillisia limnaea]EHQ01951.1 diaminopimelate epimerase [Gillisia limnaea DSM 15749]
MRVNFHKFHGTGNDFIMIDNRGNVFSKNDTNLIHHLCHRRFGIGADGLILLELPINDDEDFNMVYYNSDGNQSSMCGNGGRCIVAFANHLGIIGSETIFNAIDGQHQAIIKDGKVSLKMMDVNAEDLNENELFLDTGSPHKIVFSTNVGAIDVKKEGSKIRYSKKYESDGGTNVNFVQQTGEESFLVRTYERGVEDETYSCGTGVTAVALAVNAIGKSKSTTIYLETPGGKLEVSFEKSENTFQNIWLTGPTENVFKGEIKC